MTTKALLVSATALLATGGWVAGLDDRPAAAAPKAAHFAGCDELNRWASHLLAIPTARATELSSSPRAAVGSSATGTNVQEAGVDEPDYVKTSSGLVVRVANGRVIVSEVVDGNLHEVSSWSVPNGFANPQLLIEGDRVVVISALQDMSLQPLEDTPTTRSPARVVAPQVRVQTFDLGDPAYPQQVSDQIFSGSFRGAWLSDGVVRLMLAATPIYRQREPNQGALLLPQVTDQSNQRITTLAGCSDVLRPIGQAGTALITVVGFKPDSPTSYSTTVTAGDAQISYVSPKNLIVGAQKWSTNRSMDAFADATTTVMEFDFEGTAARYAASGTVPGALRDRWSIDAYDDTVRLALANGQSNSIVVLRREGDRLVESGRASGLGPGEEIKSVRWFDDRAIVVTFRQTDPLYVIDLSDKTHPKTAGELKVTGFSGYLHPIGDHLILGLGSSADASGQVTGSQISVFDITDAANPKLIARHELPGMLGSSVDPMTFTWLPSSNTGFTSLVEPREGTSQQVRIGYDAADGLTVEVSAPGGTGDWSRFRALPIGSDQVVISDGQDVWTSVVRS